MKKENMKVWWQFVLQVLSALLAALGANTMLLMMIYLGVW